MHLKIPSLAVFQVYFLVISRVVSFDDSLFFNSRYWKAYFDRLLTPCMNVSEMLILYKNPQIELDKNKFLLSMEVEFLQTMNFLIPYHIKAERCASKEKLDTCSKYVDTKARDLCFILDKAMSKNCVRPTINCPFKKGIYSFRNCTVNKMLINWFPTTTDYWRMKFITTKQNSEEVISCYEVHAQIRLH